MSILFETTFGPFVVDLETRLCPLASANLLKLAKVGFYSGCPVSLVQRNFSIQFGHGLTGSQGLSIWKLLSLIEHQDSTTTPPSPSSSSSSSSSSSKDLLLPFPTPNDIGAQSSDEARLPELCHDRPGCLGLVTAGWWGASELYVTVGEQAESLDGTHTRFGRVEEGLEYLQRMQTLALIDGNGVPLQRHRITAAHVLHDPFADPPLLSLVPRRLAELLPTDGSTDGRVTLDPSEALASVAATGELGSDENHAATAVRAERAEEEAARARAHVLTALGDLPDAEARPPENVVFVCQLNAKTEERGLTTLFSQFGKVLACDVVRDRNSGDSLGYAFIEFETKDAAERAFLKMNDVLVDHRRIKVDFSQSVSLIFKQRRQKPSAPPAPRQRTERPSKFSRRR